MEELLMGIVIFIAYFINGNIFEKAYVIFIVAMFALMIKCLSTFCSEGGKKKLEFILKAQEEGRYVMGKMSCFTKEGTYDSWHYCVEYMYVVNDKRYFVTYKINPNLDRKMEKETMNGDALAFDILKYPTLYYSAKLPSIVYCKAEAFTSFETFSKTETPKTNNYRDVNKDWTTPIDLIKLR